MAAGADAQRMFDAASITIAFENLRTAPDVEITRTLRIEPPWPGSPGSPVRRPTRGRR